jgi:hypothetical protein
LFASTYRVIIPDKPPRIPSFSRLETNISGDSLIRTLTEAISSCGVNLVTKKLSKALFVSSIAYLSFSIF